MPKLTSRWIVLALALVGLFLLLWLVLRVAGPTYGSDVDGTWTISVTPEHPRVGDVIEVRASANGTQSPSTLNLSIAQDEAYPVVELIDNKGGYGAIVTLHAVGPGTATISGTGFFEKPVCPTPGSDFCYPQGFYLTTPDIVIKVSGVATQHCGDANRDGVVNSVDAFLLLLFKAGIIFPNPYPYIGDVDVDGNGIVNAIDATVILQFHAGLVDALHCPPPMTP